MTTAPAPTTAAAPGPGKALDRPVLVTGTPRSGKSLIRTILSSSRDFLCVEEPLMIWSVGMGDRPDDRRTAADATDAVRRAILDDCAGMLARSGRARYLDDLAYHALRIPFVRAVMPQARIVHVVRNAEAAIPELLYGWTYKDGVGKAVARRWRSLRLRTLPRMALRFAQNYVASRVSGRRKSWGPRPPGLAEFSARHSVAEVAAFQWTQMVRTALDDLEADHDGPHLTLRFERLLADPAGEARRLVEFCEPSDPEVVIQTARSLVDPAYVFEKKVHPSPEEWERIRDMVRPVQERVDRIP